MISYYGLIISISCLCVLTLIEIIAKKENMEYQYVWKIGFWAIIIGIVGARIYHVLDYADYYARYPINTLKIWEGGLGIIGGILFGGLFIFYSLKKSNQSVYKWFDIIGITLPLGQSIGRFGNLVNLENFGLPTNLIWGIYIPQNLRPPEYIQNKLFHPVFIYESIGCLIIFLGQMYIYKKYGLNTKSKHGTYFTRYLVGYFLLRFFLEFIRINTWQIGFLNIAQLISILILMWSFNFLYSKK